MRELAMDMREADWAECQDAGFETPLAAVTDSVNKSTECLFCVVGGRVIGAYGVVRDSVLTRTGVLWLLTSNVADSNKKTFVACGRLCLVSLLARWRKLVVGIGSRHVSAIRFAYRSGFKPGETYPNETTGAPFTHHSIGA